MAPGTGGNVMKKTVFFASLIFLLLSLPLWGLEVREGRIKLSLDESNGKFSAYYEQKPGSNDWIPLLFERDPRTTGFGFLVGNRIYSMGESSGFSQKAGKESGGAYFEWKSSSFLVKEQFSFIRSEGATLADGFVIKITITNTSSRDQTIGVHYLFDTYLGENDSLHFTTDGGVQLKNETEYEAIMPEYWISPSSQKDFKGLQGMVQGPGISVPDRLIFANWKRLQENTWNFTVQPSRNFNLLPYSVNDSAVCYYYLPKKVAPGEKREITFAFGAYNGGRYAATTKESSDAGIRELYDKAVESSSANPDDLDTLIREDLIAVNDLIDKIDQYLQVPDTLSDDDIDVLGQILSTLEQRKSRYDR